MFGWKNVRDKLWVVWFHRMYLFVNRIKRIFFVDVHRTPRLPFSERLSLQCQAFSCYGEVIMENFWEKPKVLLKFFIHHTRSLVILLISSINSLQYLLSSRSGLVSSIIGTNKHLRYQSICYGIYTFIASQDT